MPIHKVKGGYKWGKHGHTYKSRRGAEVQARAAYANGYRGDRKSLPMYRGDMSDPMFDPNHQAFMQVADAGASCATCEYYTTDDEHGRPLCSNEYFQKWNGSNVIPVPPGLTVAQVCSDWYEPR